MSAILWSLMGTRLHKCSAAGSY